jgi:hypothetical protein
MMRSPDMAIGQFGNLATRNSRTPIQSIPKWPIAKLPNRPVAKTLIAELPSCRIA